MNQTLKTPRLSLRWLAMMFVVFALMAASCGSSDDAASSADTDTDTADAQDETDAQEDTDTDTEGAGGEPDQVDLAGTYDTTAGVEAAQWSDTIDISMGDGAFTFSSNGLPDHELPDQFMAPVTGSFVPPVTADETISVDSDVAVTESPVDQTITTSPVYSDTTTDTNLGLIGVVISGAQMFNDYEDMERDFVAIDDNFSVDGVGFVDSCNGHPAALAADGSGRGNYHYHGIPYCITDDIDADGEHSSVLGFLIDGFPFYGNKDEGGVVITSDDLDECSGHFGATPEFPEGIYHYHLTEDRAPYSIDCYHGEVEQAAQGGGERPEGGPGDAAGDERPPRGERPEGGPGDAAGGGVTAEAGEVAAEDADEAAARSAVVMAAQWADNVEITIDGDTVRFASDGLPSHEYLDTYLGDGQDGKFIAGGVEAYDASFSFPLLPTMADASSSTPNGAIGVAISGAVYFNPFEGDGSGTVANDDNSTIDGIPFIDACGGHPLPNAVSYHYHGIPFCITDAVDTPGQHSVLIGYLFDGFPIYGPQDVDGEEPTDLDECMGHVGATPEFPDGTYHYHVSSTANYISECFMGVS